MQISLTENVSRDLKQPIEMARWRGSETSALVWVTGVIALCSLLLFAGVRLIVAGGPLTDGSESAAEIRGID